MDVRKLLYGAALAIVLALFIGYAQHTFFPSPKYEDFCPQKQVQPVYTEETCVVAGGQWNPSLCAPDGKDCTPGQCYPDFTCQKEHSAASDAYGKKAFTVLIIASVVVFILGFVLSGVAVIGNGIMGGAILEMIYASIRFWGNIGEYWRLIVLGVALVALIFVGYRTFKK